MSGTPVVTTDTSGNRIETYPDYVDANGYTIKKVVTTYQTIPYSTIASSGSSIFWSIVFLFVNSFLLWLGYLLFGLGKKTGYVILGLLILAVVCYNIYKLSTLKRTPRCTYNEKILQNSSGFNSTSSYCSEPDDKTVVGIYFDYQWNISQLLAGLFFLTLISNKIFGSTAPTVSENVAQTASVGGGKRKSTRRRRT